MTGDKLSTVARMRMQTMVHTNNGFEIAETDLKLRGPGDITGTQQSGLLDLKIADIAKDGAILEAARKSAIALLQDDPHLTDAKNQVCKQQLIKKRQGKPNWSKVS